MGNANVRKRRPGAGRKPNPIPTKAIRVPAPIANKLLETKNSGILSMLLKADIGKIFSGKTAPSVKIPLFESRVQAGFPSLVDEVSGGALDLNEYLIPHQTSTFFVRVTGESMTGVGIFPGDLLVVDRSLSPLPGKIVIAVLDGEMTVKRLLHIKNRVFLQAENEDYPDIEVMQENDFFVWGVVTNVIHSLQ